MFVYNQESKKKEPLIGGEWDPLDVSSLGDRSTGYGSNGSSGESSSDDDDDDSDDSNDSEEEEESSSSEEETESDSDDDDDDDSDVDSDSDSSEESENGWTDEDGLSTDVSSHQGQSLNISTDNNDDDDDVLMNDSDNDSSADDKEKSAEVSTTKDDNNQKQPQQQQQQPENDDEEEEEQDSDEEETSDDDDEEYTSDDEEESSDDDEEEEEDSSSEEDDDEEEEDSDDDDTKDGETFDDEPVENVEPAKSFEKIPSYRDPFLHENPFFDEEIGETTTSPNDADSGTGGAVNDRGDRSRLIIFTVCFCCIVLVVVAVVAGVTAGGKAEDGAEPLPSEELTPTAAPNPPRPTLSPISISPSLSPMETSPTSTKRPVSPPTISPFPTQTIAEEITLLANADTYLKTDVVADNGQSEILRVGTDTIILVSFNISNLPEPKDIFNREKTALLQLDQVLEGGDGEGDTAYANLRVSRLPSTPLSIEALESNPFSSLGGVTGPIFVVGPTNTTTQVDITFLLFGQPPYSDFGLTSDNRSTQETQLFLIIQHLGIETVDPPPPNQINITDVVFYSRESVLNPPQLVVGLEVMETKIPTTSPAPSISDRPSLRPTKSPSPTLTSTLIPTGVPTLVPTTNATDNNNKDTINPAGETKPPSTLQQT